MLSARASPHVLEVQHEIFIPKRPQAPPPPRLAFLKALQLAQGGSCRGACNGGLLAGYK